MRGSACAGSTWPKEAARPDRPGTYRLGARSPAAGACAASTRVCGLDARTLAACGARREVAVPGDDLGTRELKLFLQGL